MLNTRLRLSLVCCLLRRTAFVIGGRGSVNTSEEKKSRRERERKKEIIRRKEVIKKKEC